AGIFFLCSLCNLAFSNSLDNPEVDYKKKYLDSLISQYDSILLTGIDNVGNFSYKHYLDLAKTGNTHKFIALALFVSANNLMFKSTNNYQYLSYNNEILRALLNSGQKIVKDGVKYNIWIASIPENDHNYSKN